MRVFVFSTAFAAVAVIATPALALQQPDGTVIPTTNSLQMLFDSRGEMINAVNDGAGTPETFMPSCSLTFTVLQRNAGYTNSFGWYNVTGTKPTPDQLHEFLACSDGVGTQKILAIKDSPLYTGGDVGFYQATGPGCPTPTSNENIFFSERKYNPDGSQANPFYHLLIYNSTATQNAFYFCWEDLLAGGDNDFDDLTTFVTGIACTGGGGPCDTGMMGACALGTMQCQSGMLACVPQVMPGTEQCDGFDNDCDGSIDNGDLCQQDYVCDKGTCVPKCNTGEFPCPPETICADMGLCVDPMCANVMCPSGKKCVAGQCIGPCDNVVCPYGQVCQLGACVDPCAPLTCDDNQVCEDGVCIDKCPCKTCTNTQTCMPDGHCVETTCMNVMCNTGMHCEGGQCVDDCQGAMCPLGEICQAGQCVPGSDGGTTGGTASSGGVSTSGGLGTTTTTGGGGGSGGGGSFVGQESATGHKRTADKKGCGCSLPDEDEPSPFELLAAGGLALLAFRRRRRRR